jgi:hypothetical protein
MWSKKWYLKRNISCDAHLLNELLETDVPWDDGIVVSAGKLRKLWGSLSELCSSVWQTTLKDSSEACAIACQNCAVYSVFMSGMTSHCKIAQFNWQFIGRLKIYPGWCWYVLPPAQNNSLTLARRYFQFRAATFQEGSSACTPNCFRPQTAAQWELFQPRGMHIWTWRVFVNLWEYRVSGATCSCWNAHCCHNK